MPPLSTTFEISKLPQRTSSVDLLERVRHCGSSSWEGKEVRGCPRRHPADEPASSGLHKKSPPTSSRCSGSRGQRGRHRLRKDKGTSHASGRSSKSDGYHETGTTD